MSEMIQSGLRVQEQRNKESKHQRVSWELLELTEHHLQPHQTSHEVVEVDGHVGVRVAGHQQLVDGVVEGEPCTTSTSLIRLMLKLRCHHHTVATDANVGKSPQTETYHHQSPDAIQEAEGHRERNVS